MTPFSKIFASLETVVAVRGEASAFSMGFEGSHLRKRWGITFFPRCAMLTSHAGMFLNSCSTIYRLQISKTFKTAPRFQADNQNHLEWITFIPETSG